MLTAQGIAFQPYATSNNVDVPSLSRLNQSIAELKSTSSFIKRPIKIGKIQKNRSKSNPEVPKEKKIEPIFGTAKSQIVALLLCLFLGYFGIHRFYLGYPLEGLIQLLILGTAIKFRLMRFFVLLWVLIDLIRIFLGDLQPRNGSYYDSF
ncbi:MAG: TM2 domain-containing protein [Bacteroidetes bacterium]|nr:TM2 domain-containing protein [Bacteroidota bacterium]